MLIYWVVFFILFLFSYVELISARQSLVLLRCVILFIACMVGFRYNIGADWETYVIIYNRQIPSLLDPEYRILMEPLFWILGSLCKTLGLSYACFFIILSLISFVVLFIVIRRIGCGYIYLPILLYFCLFFLSCNPIKIDKIPTGINNIINHEYLIIPATPNISASPIILANENEIIGEINVIQNNILPKTFSFFMFFSFLCRL